jgi:hypothetical protein
MTVAQLILEYIKALVPLAWPVLILFLVTRFQPEIRGAFQRLKRGKLLGAELELSDKLDDIRGNVIEIVEKAKNVIPETATYNVKAAELSYRKDLSLIAQTPSVEDLLKIYNRIEVKLKFIVANSGWTTKDHRRLNLRSSIDDLSQRNIIPNI